MKWGDALYGDKNDFRWEVALRCWIDSARMQCSVTPGIFGDWVQYLLSPLLVD